MPSDLLCQLLYWGDDWRVKELYVRHAKNWIKPQSPPQDTEAESLARSLCALRCSLWLRFFDPYLGPNLADAGALKDVEARVVGDPPTSFINCNRLLAPSASK